MSNKFLGINSINVLKEYIDNTIHQNYDNSRVLTLQAYKYVLSTKTVQTPNGGSFDPEGAKITYPNNWGSLNSVIYGLTPENTDEDGQNAAIEDALKNGSIYMSAGVLSGGSNFSNWSTPVKISGQNGVSVEFRYTYDPNLTPDSEICSKTPKGVSASNPYEYVWTKYGDDEWMGPSLWAVHSTNASVILYRYRTTAEPTQIPAPTSNIDPDWSTSAVSSIAQDKPYMWMSWKYVPAFNPQVEEPSDEGVWSEPILFGHYGMDGKDGLDGNIPSYSITLYRKTGINETAPDFVVADSDTINNVIENNPEWKNVPDTIDDESMLWYIVINVNGGDKENPEIINTVASVSEVMRFSAIDGELKSYPRVKYRYYWSSNQTLPDNITEWSDVPVYNSNDVEGSLWMSTGEFIVNTVTNVEEQTKDWSEPVKLSGPRGPIAYDYRVESMFGAGTADKAPTSWKRISEVQTNDLTPYIWEKRYLSLYRMKYADKANADGTFDVVEDAFIKTIGDPDIFRLSGLNGLVGKDGANGNRLNSIDYTTVDKNLGISNFDDINYFISNSSSDTHYVLNGNKFGDFVSGYTGKFVNIGTGDMIITAVNAQIVGSNTAVTEIIVKPQESIDLIGYNNDNKCEFILIGKPVIENPIVKPSILSETELLNAINLGGEVKLEKDIELSSRPLTIENDVIIDLNGHTITAPKFTESNGDVLEGETDSYVFWVKDGNLTIKGNGKVIAQPAKYSIAVWAQGGNVTIESGEFRNGGQDTDLIYASSTGNITINGGRFIAAPKGDEPGTKNDYSALNLKNGDRATCSISVKGGHYYGFNPAENNSEPDEAWWEAHPNGFVADGYTSIKNGDYYSVIPLPEI